MSCIARRVQYMAWYTVVLDFSSHLSLKLPKRLRLKWTVLVQYPISLCQTVSVLSLIYREVEALYHCLKVIWRQHLRSSGRMEDFASVMKWVPSICIQTLLSSQYSSLLLPSFSVTIDIFIYMYIQIQTGFSRLGSHYWGFEMMGVIPDIGMYM